MEKGKGSFDELADLGSGLKVVMLDVSALREQDINARVMDQGMFTQLVSNIRKRGTLESLPFCALTDRGVEIVSGHHRCKAARTAGLSKIPVLLDFKGLTRSQIAAKQLAHNAISGFDDKETLREIAKIITDVDDMLESAVGEDIFKSAEAELQKLNTPQISFDWKGVSFLFLPHQVADMEKLVEKAAGSEYVGVAGIEAFKPFVDALEKTQKFQDVKAVGTAIHLMTCAALQHLGDAGYGEGSGEWVPISKILGGAAVPAESAEVIKSAIDRMAKNGDITGKNRWQAIELWAADYLGGE